jgi:hypothetical protein
LPDNLKPLQISKLLKSDQFQPQLCKIAPHHVRKVERFVVNNQPVTMEQLAKSAASAPAANRRLPPVP